MTRSRLLVPLSAAIAVLVVLGGMWWLSSANETGSETGPAAGGQADPGAGGGVPGDPGTGKASPEPVPPPSADPTPASPLSVPVHSYFPRSPALLALNYAIGVPECYGSVGEPVVTETPDAVVVTLERVEPKLRPDVACIEIALMRSVDIRLSAPLGDRVVKDGSYDGKPVSPADAPYDNGTT